MVRASNDLSKRARGRWGETLAVTHLRRLGYRIVDRNWTYRTAEVRGELDVVARHGDLVVFCEVKARRSGGYGGAVAAVDERKQQRIRALAAAWLSEHDGSLLDVRFDVIAIEGVSLEHYEAAF